MGRFGAYQGAELGWWGESNFKRDRLVERVQTVLGGPVQLLAYGPERTERVGVITGSGGFLVDEAARLGLDTLVTGEGPHHAAIAAAELGLNVVYGGHYATETFGIRALASILPNASAWSRSSSTFRPERDLATNGLGSPARSPNPAGPLTVSRVSERGFR